MQNNSGENELPRSLPCCHRYPYAGYVELYKSYPITGLDRPFGPQEFEASRISRQHMKAVRLSALLRIIYLKQNHFSGVYNVAAVLCLQILVHVMLFLMVNVFFSSTFRCICAVPIVAVFCSSVVLYFLGMLLRYFLNDFELVPFAPVITGITFLHIIIINSGGLHEPSCRTASPDKREASLLVV